MTTCLFNTEPDQDTPIGDRSFGCGEGPAGESDEDEEYPQ